MNVSSGRLNRRITIQQPSQTRDESGQLTTDWSDLCTTWAGIHAITSKEVYAASGFTSQVSHVITIRYRPQFSVRSNMRVIYEQRRFLIQAVADPDEGKVQINLLCLELNEGQQ